jgi:hypothetical protein
MTKHATVIRYNKGLEEADKKIVELLDRYKNVKSRRPQPVGQHQLCLRAPAYNMLELSRVVVQGAILRDESRGAHYKPDFPERDDEHFLKTTKASFTASRGPALRVRGRRYAVHQAAPAPLRRNQVSRGRLTMANKTVQFEIKRQASPDAPAVWESFEIEWRPGMNVISA